MTHPLSAALVVAALGLATAFLVLALRGHFAAVASRPPAGAAGVTTGPATAATTPAATSAVPATTPSGPQTISGTLAADVTIPLSSDNSDGVSIQAGVAIHGAVMMTNGQLTVVDLVVGEQPAAGDGKKKHQISGSTATAGTITVATTSGTVTVLIDQDLTVRGTTDHPLALEIARPVP